MWMTSTWAIMGFLPNERRTLKATPLSYVAHSATQYSSKSPYLAKPPTICWPTQVEETNHKISFHPVSKSRLSSWVFV